MTTDEEFSEQKLNFSIKTVLSRSFSVFFKSPFVFIGLHFLALFPKNIITFLTDSSPMGEGLAGFVYLIPALVIQVATIYGVSETLRGNPARFGKSISIGMARFGSLMLVIILFSVFVAGFVAVVGAILFIPLSLLMESGASIVVIIIGAILGCIVAVQFFRWSLFIPACVIERLGLIDSLQRSSKLTKGLLLKIAGVYLLSVLFMFSFAYFVLRTISMVSLLKNVSMTLISLICDTIIGAMLLAFFCVVNTIIYYSLREVKEGVPVEQLNLFDWVS